MMDNTEEEVMRYILESQRCRPTKRAINWSHEEQYHRLFDVMQKTLRQKKAIFAKLAKLKKEESMLKQYEILMKDTSKMTESQRNDHEIRCNKIRVEIGMTE